MNHARARANQLHRAALRGPRVTNRVVGEPLSEAQLSRAHCRWSTVDDWCACVRCGYACCNCESTVKPKPDNGERRPVEGAPGYTTERVSFRFGHTPWRATDPSGANYTMFEDRAQAEQWARGDEQRVRACLVCSAGAAGEHCPGCPRRRA
jgi:hypothetical protein